MADEMGILLWSEFGELSQYVWLTTRPHTLTCVLEFSDTEYPTNSSYIDEYVAEASYQVVNKSLGLRNKEAKIN